MREKRFICQHAHDAVISTTLAVIFPAVCASINDGDKLTTKAQYRAEARYYKADRECLESRLNNDKAHLLEPVGRDCK